MGREVVWRLGVRNNFREDNRLGCSQTEQEKNQDMTAEYWTSIP
jgi:hypothetical protein